MAPEIEGVERALDEVAMIAQGIAGRTRRRSPGRTRTRAYLEGLVADGDRLAAAAREALGQARRAAREEVERDQLPLFPAAGPAPPPPEPPGDAYPERDPRSVEPDRIVRCKEETCQAPMVMLDRGDGTPHPYDAGTVRHGERTFEQLVHVSHFHTCTAPARFRGGPR